MNVLHITPYMHPSAGGPPIVVEKLAVCGAALGWKATVITTGLYCSDDVVELEQKLCCFFPIQIMEIDRSKLRGLCSRASDIIEESIKKSDLVHIHTLWHPLTGVARTFCRKYNKPYMVMPHGMLDPYSLGVQRVKKLLYMLLVEKRNLLAANRIVFTTAEEEVLARKAHPWLPQGVVVPLGSDFPPHTEREHLVEIFCRQFPAARGKRRLLFLSRIHEKKGLDRILDAFDRIAESYPDVMLILAGSGEPEYVDDIKKRVRTIGKENSILFTGMLHDLLKWGAYAASEMFLLPSRQENFALVVAEAMHMGVPVILSDKVNSWPYVDKASAGIVLGETNIVTELEKGIRALLENPVLAREMGKGGQELARQELTWENSAKIMSAYYSEVIAEAQR